MRFLGSVLATGALSAVMAATAAQAGSCPTFESRSEGLPTAVEWRTHPALADVNSDGRLDLAGNPRKALHPYVWLAEPDGSWKASTSGLVMPAATCGVGVDFGDVNGDGHPDLAVADHCNGLFVYLGDGRGGWQLGHPSPMLGERRPYEAVRLADLDADGHLDLIALASFRGGFTVRLGDGKGGWRKAKTGLPSWGYGTDIELHDINADGYLDVVAAYTTDLARLPERSRQLHVVWLSTGPARWEAASDGFPQKSKLWAVAVGDVNGDGFTDIAASHDTFRHVAPLEIYLGDGGTTWKRVLDGLPPKESEVLYEGVSLEDLNGDGHADLTAVNHLEAGISIWIGDGKGGWSRCEETGLPQSREENRGWGVTVGDVNRDGRADVTAAFGRNGSGSVEVWIQK